MKKIMIVLLGVLLSACGGAALKSETQENKALTAEEKSYIHQIEQVGNLLYEKDIRAAHASDTLLAKIDPADYPDFVGWVTYPSGNGYTVSFYEKKPSGFSLIADVVYSESGAARVHITPDRALATAEISMIQARISALMRARNSCSSVFNTVVVPSRNSTSWDVYVLAATTDRYQVQVGGHSRVEVSKESGEVLGVTPLSKSCLALDKSGSELPEGATLSALTVSHIVTPMPVAIHVYLNLLHEISLAVSSERGLWFIEDGKVRPL